MDLLAGCGRIMGLHMRSDRGYAGRRTQRPGRSRCAGGDTRDSGRRATRGPGACQGSHARWHSSV